MQAKVKGSDSIIWKSIIWALKELDHGFKFKVGRGDTSFWYDHWLLMGPLCNYVPLVNIQDTKLSIKDVIIDGYW